MIDHTADLGIEVEGSHLKGLFINATIALMDLITDREAIHPAENRSLSVQGNDREELLINCLGEVLYLFHGEQFLTRDISLETFTDVTMRAIATGETYDPSRHEIKTEIKAVTFHQTRISKTSGKWTARVIFDV